MLAAIIYALAGALWGLYCVKLQKACFPHHSRSIDQAACLGINCLVWPFSLTLAICAKPCTSPLTRNQHPQTRNTSHPVLDQMGHTHCRRNPLQVRQMPSKKEQTPTPPRAMTPGELLAQIINGDNTEEKKEEFIEASKKVLGPACTSFTIHGFNDDR